MGSNNDNAVQHRLPTGCAFTLIAFDFDTNSVNVFIYNFTNHGGLYDCGILQLQSSRIHGRTSQLQSLLVQVERHSIGDLLRTFFGMRIVPRWR